MRLTTFLLLLPLLSIGQTKYMSVDITKTVFHETSFYFEKAINEKRAHDFSLGVNYVNPFFRNVYYKYSGSKKLFYSGGTLRYAYKFRLPAEGHHFLALSLQGRYLFYNQAHFCWGKDTYCWEDDAIEIKQDGKRMEVGLALNYSFRNLWETGHEFFFGAGVNAVSEEFRDTYSENEAIYSPANTWYGDGFELKPMVNMGFRLFIASR